jgi:hypothetical protein
MKVTATISVLLFIACFAMEVSAQGADGRSNVGSATSAVRSSPKKPKRRTARTFAAERPAPPKPVEPKRGRLVIVVNEPGSNIYLSESNSDPSLIQTTSFPQSQTGRMLTPGSYTLSVKKTGFFDEVRNVDLKPGGRRKLVINMRPQMALLTVRTNLADAAIDVENVGSFTKPIKRYLIKPGKYRIELRRRGYVTQTITADLSIAGKEQNIYAILQPLRIDTVLAQANELLGKGEITAASALVNDVLLMNNAHANANLLYGLIERRRGNSTASKYFLKAIRGGGTVAIPVKVLFNNELVLVDVAIDRDSIGLRSRMIADLNFKITRKNLGELDRMMDGGFLTYIAVKGESDFYGRGIHPQLKIFSSGSEMDPATGQIRCGQGANGGSCAIESEILFNVISGWREL